MAILSSSGKTPCVMDKLSKCVSGNKSKSDVSFMTFHLKLSHPGLEFFKYIIILETSSLQTLSKKIEMGFFL